MAVLHAVLYFVVPRSPQSTADLRAALIDQLPLWSAVAHLPVPHPNTPEGGLATGVGAALALFSCYVVAVRVSWSAPPNRTTLAMIVGVTALFCVMSILALPNSGSEDVLWYVKEARVATVYHTNPYASPPSPNPDDPYLQFGQPRRWMVRPIPYGPAWTYLAVGWQTVVGDDVVRSLLGFRALLLSLVVANAGLVWFILGRLDPTRRVVGLLLYAWNPVVVMFGDHLDTVMAFLLVVAVYLMITGRQQRGLVVLTLSVLTKFVTGPLIAVYLLSRWRQASLRSAVWAAGIGLAIAVLAFLPFWRDSQGLAWLAREPYNPNPGSLFNVRRLVFTPALLVLLTWAAWPRYPIAGEVVLRWAIVMLWFSLCFLPIQFAWYLASPLVLAALAPRGPIVLLTLAVSLGAMLNAVIGHLSGSYIAVNPALYYVLWWGPPIGAILWIVHRHGQRRVVRVLNRLGQARGAL
jgi:hypothetical protein